MAIRKAAVVVAIAAGAALAVTGTTNASPSDDCSTTGVSVQSDTECAEYEFARSGEDHGDKDWDKDHGDKHHGDKDWDKGHGDKDWDKDHGKHHGDKGKDKDKDKDKDHGKHHGDKHHKKQVHKKPHGGVETGDGSLAALL